MIIVSQDKSEIINFNNIENIWICSDEEGIFTIEATADTNTSLGEYKTEERAKEVLQEIIENYLIEIDYKYNQTLFIEDLEEYRKSLVYEMPEK